VDGLPKDIQFDVAIRLVGAVQDFETAHTVEVVLSDPQLVEVGRLDIPVDPRKPPATHIPGYELNHAVGARIDFEADVAGGYDLSFAVDGKAEHRAKATISVVVGGP
jgi:hypothetical protein